MYGEDGGSNNMAARRFPGLTEAPVRVEGTQETLGESWAEPRAAQ